MTVHPSRRTVLGGLAGLAGLAAGSGALGGCGAARDLETSVGDSLGLGELESTDRSFDSAARGTGVTYRVLAPRDARGPVRPVVYLHGLGGDHASTLDREAVSAALLAPSGADAPACALVTVDGGAGYFHPRASGEDAGRMVRDELLPRLRDEAGLSIDRIALAGFSMGGYGALLLASGWDAAATGSALAGVAVCDPALWLEPGDSAPGAFDDREDFVDHDVFAPARLERLRALPTWVCVGTEDPFRTATEHLQQELDCPGGVRPGGHDAAFQRAVCADQLGFLSARLNA